VQAAIAGRDTFDIRARTCARPRSKPNSIPILGAPLVRLLREVVLKLSISKYQGLRYVASTSIVSADHLGQHSGPQFQRLRSLPSVFGQIINSSDAFLLVR
jgi:hypothetical protein